jgi:hypothetical protein
MTEVVFISNVERISLPTFSPYVRGLSFVSYTQASTQASNLNLTSIFYMMAKCRAFVMLLVLVRRRVYFADTVRCRFDLLCLSVVWTNGYHPLVRFLIK